MVNLKSYTCLETDYLLNYIGFYFQFIILRDAVDAGKRVPTKEKIDRQLSGQCGATTPFMKVGDAHHSNKTVSFNTQSDEVTVRQLNFHSIQYACT